MMADTKDEKLPGDAFNDPVPAENADPTGREDAVDPAATKPAERD